MAYRNKTYVAFSSEDIRSYRLMRAWRANQHIDFNFFDAHDINVALDTSQRETIRRRLRERLANTRQAILLLGEGTRARAARPSSFLYYEIEVIEKLGLPVVVANLNGSRRARSERLPARLAAPYYTISVSFQPKVIQFALDEYVPLFAKNLGARRPVAGPHFYKAEVYRQLGL